LSSLIDALAAGRIDFASAMLTDRSPRTSLADRNSGFVGKMCQRICFVETDSKSMKVRRLGWPGKNGWYKQERELHFQFSNTSCKVQPFHNWAAVS
jgi:hypothetical protein